MNGFYSLLKKRITAFAVLSVIMLQSVSFAANVSDLGDSTVEISGKTNNGLSEVSVMALKPGKTLKDVKAEGLNAVLYTEQKTADMEGNYSFIVSKKGMTSSSEIYVSEGGEIKLVKGGAVTDAFTLVKGDSVEIIGESTYKYDDVTIMILKAGKTLDDVETEGVTAALYVDQTTTDMNGKYLFNISRKDMTGGDEFLVFRSGTSAPFTEGKILLNEDIEGKKAINVMDYGADNTGVKDNTFLLTELHSTGKKIYYPIGTYRFNGRNLNISGGVVFEDRENTKIINDISDNNIMQFDDKGNLIGLIHNHLEQSSKENGAGWRMDIGDLASPPVSTADYDTKVDFIPYWYNDFGLERTLINAGFGSTTWYYWDWNFHDRVSDDPAKAYDPERHPLLGFYRGDDPTVLDWQCYWLKEYGAKAAILIGKNDSPSMPSEWNNPGDAYYWIYQLLNNTPNFNNIGYIMHMPTLMRTKNDEGQYIYHPDELAAWWNAVIDTVYGEHDNCYCIEKDGKRYPVIYLLEEALIMLNFNKDTARVKDFFANTAQRFRDLGYDGMALFSRNSSSAITGFGAEWFEQNGILRYMTRYEPLGSKNGNSDSGNDTYGKMVENYSPESDVNYPVGHPETYINNAFLGAYTHDPHPNTMNSPGITPELFEQLIEKEIEIIEERNMPKIITCYNMSEWAESGPGLQPNMKNRFGYLEAMKNAIVEKPQISMNTIWYDSDNIPLEGYSDSESLVQKTEIYNTCFEGRTAVVITALYNDGVLTSIQRKTVELTGRKTNVEFTLNKSQLKNATRIKVMGFDSMNNIIPLSAVNILE